MTSSLRKLSGRSVITQESFVSSDYEDEIDNELGCGDELIFCDKLSGTLSFTDIDNKLEGSQPQQSCDASSSFASDSLEVGYGDKFELEHLVFEVVSTQVIKEGRDKYVLYCVMVIKVPGLDTSKAIVQRRYSEFLHFYNSLQKKFPDLMQNVIFPKKTLLGNFSDNTLAKRSCLFQEFLTQVCTKEEIKQSKEIGEFFYDRDLKEAYDFIRCSHYEQALPLLSNGLHLQEKLLGETHSETIATRCGLIACLNCMEQYNEAIHHAEIVIKQLENSDNLELLVTLLQLSIRLCWTVGHDKRYLEKKLMAIRQRSGPVESRRTLLEMAVKRYI